MTQVFHNNRRGTALLVVLAVLIVTMSAAVVLAEQASTARSNAKCMIDGRNADAAMETAELVIEDWLRSESASVVIPLYRKEPAVSILSDQLAFGKQSILIRITGWDQCGMVPLEAVQGGSMFRLAVPEDVLQRVDRIDFASDVSAGLDLIRMASRDGAINVFPAHPRSIETDTKSYSRQWRQPASHGEYIEPAGDAALDDTTRPAIGAMIATHNTAPGRINVNTAPMPLVERALLEAGRGGLDVIERHRTEGKPMALNEIPRRTGGDNDSQFSLQLVGSSSSWSFRIDVQVGFAARSWWLIYQRNGSTWECVQRLVIGE